VAKHLFVVLTNPTSEDQEAEFNRWYDEVHLPEVLQVPGFVAAQRFRLTHETMLPMAGPYLALYEMETDDPVAAADLLTRYANEGRLEMSSAMHATNLAASIFTPIGERLVA
jgi:hypothetical protein